MFSFSTDYRKRLVGARLASAFGLWESPVERKRSLGSITGTERFVRRSVWGLPRPNVRAISASNFPNQLVVWTSQISNRLDRENTFAGQRPSNRIRPILESKISKCTGKIDLFIRKLLAYSKGTSNH